MEIVGQVIFNLFRLGTVVLLLFSGVHVLRFVPGKRWVEAISEKKQDGDKISGARLLGLLSFFVAASLGLYQGMFAGGEMSADAVIWGFLAFTGAVYGVNSARSYGKERLAVKNGKQEQ